MGQSSGEVIAIAAVFTAFELCMVGLRLVARRFSRVSLGLDDYFILVAAVTFVLFLTVPLIVQAAVAHTGDHVPGLSVGQPESQSYLFSVCERIFEPCHVIPITCAKLSLLFFYRRIFRGKLFSAVTWCTIGLATSWGIGYFFALLLMCTPLLPYVREGHANPEVHCVNEMQLYYSLSISDFLIDIVILVTPVPFIWRLHMPLRHKIAVTAVFMLGVLTIGASVARLGIFVHMANLIPQNAMDYTYNTAPTSYVTLIEASLAIVSACLPTLRPLFHGWSPESVVNSFRSAFSLPSVRSNGSNSSRGSRHYRRTQKDNVLLTNDDKSTASTTKLNGNDPAHDLEEQMSGEYAMTSSVTLGPGQYSDMPNDAIVVQQSWQNLKKQKYGS